MLKIFVAFNVFWYFSNAYLYLWSVGVVPLKPLHSYFVTIGVSLILLIGYRQPLISRGPMAGVVLWACTLIMLYLFSFIFVSDSGPEALQELITSSEALVLLIVFALLLRDRGAFRAGTSALVAVAIFAVILNYFDFFTRGSVVPLSIVPGRAAGMYVDPNSGGYCLVFAMVLSAWILPRKLRLLYCMFIATGVLLTFSRASIILWAVAVFSMAWCGWFGLSRAISVVSAGSLILIAGVALTSGVLAEYAIQAGAGKYLDSNTLPRIASSFITQDDESTKDRILVAKRGIDAFLKAPVLGNGIGALKTREFQFEPHNQYILVAAELGVVGLGLILALMYLLWRNGTDVTRIIAITYGVGCLFLHVLLWMPAMPLTFALAVSYTAGRPDLASRTGRRRLVLT